jgi:hypothetical protein
VAQSDRPTIAIGKERLEQSNESGEGLVFEPRLSGGAGLRWDDYELNATECWGHLLDDPTVTERRIHEFLLANPCFLPVPGGYDTGRGARGHNGTAHGAVFTEPPLPGITRPVPDFLRIRRDTGGFRAMFFEIEDPNKPMVRNDGRMRQEYEQALRQVTTWRQWFREPAHVQLFRQLYRLNDRPDLDLTVEYVLIYGRRRALLGHQDAVAHRDDSLPELVQSMTFDRLRPSADGRFDFGVKVAGQRFLAISAPPTLSWINTFQAKPMQRSRIRSPRPWDRRGSIRHQHKSSPS